MFKAYGLYTHIRANRLRSALLLAGFVVLLIALTFSFALLIEAFGAGRAPFDKIVQRALEDMRVGLPTAVAAAGVWFFLAYLFHQKMIDLATGATELSRAESPRVYNLLENLCISRGVPIPALQVIETDALNAYASGLTEGQYKVAVTRGLMLELTDAELEAVLAHELTHIRNRDVQLMVIAVIFAGIFAFVADLTFRRWDFPFGFSPQGQSTREDRRTQGPGAVLAIIIALAIIVLSWGASTLIRFAISRTREYLADAGAAELTKNPDAMISALRKIEAHSVIPDIGSRMHAFFIESPARLPESGWFATHPSVEERIEALVQYAGGQEVAFTPAEDHARLEDSGPDPAPATMDEAAFIPHDGRSPLDPPQQGPWG